MRLSRSRIGVVVLFGAMTLTLTALAFPAMLGLDKADGNQDRVIASTKFGPLTEADRDFVVKVRAAGLWEYPLGEMVRERGTTKEMKTAGEHLIVGHAGLDAMCREISPSWASRCPTGPRRSRRASWRRWTPRPARSSTRRRSTSCG